MKSMMRSRWLSTLGVLLVALPASLQAFEGFGGSTVGENGGTVVEVTSLADSGPGTLREALAWGDNVRIVFRVGGVIDLVNPLKIKDRAFVTIDGSTAPAPGVTLRGEGIFVSGSRDLILTHLRVRSSLSDGITIKNGSYNVVVDHCSVADSNDENISVTNDSRDVTVSWSIIGDTRPDSFELGTKGMLVATFDRPPATNVSVHHTLFANLAQRSPLISSAGLFDLRNNVIRDWKSYGVGVRDGGWGNIVNNVFRTKKAPGRAIKLVADGERDAGPVYIDGNRGPRGGDINALSTSSEPFSVAPVTTDPADVVEQKVLTGAGAFPRDAVDALLAGPAS